MACFSLNLRPEQYRSEMTLATVEELLIGLDEKMQCALQRKEALLPFAAHPRDG